MHVGKKSKKRIYCAVRLLETSEHANSKGSYIKIIYLLHFLSSTFSLKNFRQSRYLNVTLLRSTPFVEKNSKINKPLMIDMIKTSRVENKFLH